MTSDTFFSLSWVNSNDAKPSESDRENTSPWRAEFTLKDSFFFSRPKRGFLSKTPRKITKKVDISTMDEEVAIMNFLELLGALVFECNFASFCFIIKSY